MMGHGRYILKDGKPVPEPDLLTWARWIEEHPLDRIVAKTVIVEGGAEGGILVSTVFLGLDHRHILPGPPILFETLVFGGICDGDGERYCTTEEALEGHWRLVEKVKRAERVESI